MARFFGSIGFALTVESEPGIWTEKISEVNYIGDVERNARRYEPGISVHDNPVLNNQISIVADNFAIGNVGFIRYVKWAGTKWKITNVELRRPRLLLTIGEMYNG
jgi:hypothetical protein